VKGKGRQGKVVDKNRRCLRIMTIRYAPAPDAESRLSRAIDILLESAAREREEKAPPQDRRPEGVAGQSNGEKG